MIEAHDERLWKLYSCEGTENPADVFTKPVYSDNFFAVHNIYLDMLDLPMSLCDQTPAHKAAFVRVFLFYTVCVWRIDGTACPRRFCALASWNKAGRTQVGRIHGQVNTCAMRSVGVFDDPVRGAKCLRVLGADRKPCRRASGEDLCGRWPKPPKEPVLTPLTEAA